ncbi:MAG: ABC transporter ATP-binding protein [Candidatus Limnocylindria bacterium]
MSDHDRTVIDAVGVGKVYAGTNANDSFRALAGVDLTVREGEFVSLIGPSGCGKTTLLKIIDGLIPYEEGELRVMGKPVTGPGPERAVVFQNFALLPWLTVLENVQFGLQLRGVDRETREETARQNITTVGLKGFERAYPRQLSGGMQQRVGLARALSVDPEILLMDEPFGSLDAQTRNLLQADLLRVWDASRKTVTFVTHAMDEAVFLSDRVVLMATGPGRVSEIIDIDLPRPRTDETRISPRFVELTSYVWDRLRGMILGGAAEPSS